MTARRITSVATIIVLTLACLFYLQFGLQALVHHLPQGVLALVGAAALAWSAVRRAHGRTASLVALLGTLPILALHAAMTVEDAGELPFLVGSVPVPVIAAVAWISGRTRRADLEALSK
jgi:hypothetical protein